MNENRRKNSGRFLWPLLLLSFIFPLTTGAAATNFVLAVPFTSQAPLAQWKDQRQQDGCEEAAALMAMAWVKDEGLKAGQEITKKEWRQRIVNLSDFEKKRYGEYRDIALDDMISWIFKDYFKYEKVSVKEVLSAADIVSELEEGNVVLTPMNGRLLKNPYFTAPGPERHMLLIKGYNYQTKQFITNDPGTRRGENYRYSEKIIFNAIRAYLTGYHQPIKKLVKEMIVVEK
jgi:hypothetical protein